MKSKYLIALTMAVALAYSAVAADKPVSADKNPATAPLTFLDRLTLAPVGAYQQAGFTHGPSEYGAGFQIEGDVNPFVRIGVRNLAFQGNDHNVYCEKDGSFKTTETRNDWGGSAIDETFVYGKADFVSFAEEKLKLFGAAGGGYDWRDSDWFFGIQAGLSYSFTPKVSVGVSEELDAFFHQDKKWKTLLALNFKL